MKFHYPILSAVCLFFIMDLPVGAVDIQHVAPPAAPANKAGKEMQHDMGGMGMGGGMGMHHGMGGMGMHQGMGGMHGMMAGMSEEEKDKHMRSMQEHMLKMHDLSNQILAEKDSAKKEQLKNEQIQLMKAHHAEMMSHHEAKQAAPK